MSDPVASKSGFLSTYMSNHPDTLVAYVTHYTKNKQVTTATMQAIDSKGMNMSYAVKGSSALLSVRIPFDPPLLGYEEVKPRLLSMKVDAEEALGMAKNPMINEYTVPWERMVYGPTPLQIALAWLTFSESSYASTIKTFLPANLIRWSWYAVFVLHGTEGLYQAYLCRKHQTSFFNSLLWTLSTTLLGFPFLFEYRSLVKKARIDSIMKGN